VSVVRSHCKW